MISKGKETSGRSLSETGGGGNSTEGSGPVTSTSYFLYQQIDFKLLTESYCETVKTALVYTFNDSVYKLVYL